MSSISKFPPAKKSPLSGQKILVTRPDTPQSSLSKMLESQGASVLTFPMINIQPPTSWDSFDQTVLRTSNLDWAVFTSRNGVEYCMERLKELETTPQKIFASLKIACVGQATASALANYGLPPEFVPEHFQSEGLISAFSQYDLQAKKCWLIQAEVPRETLRRALEKQGTQIIFTPVYRNAPPEDDYSFLFQKLAQKKIDWMVFASASAVHNFYKILPSGFWDCLPVPPKIVCLGKITATAVRSYGWTVEALPLTQDFEHLVQTICEQMKSGSQNIAP